MERAKIAASPVEPPEIIEIPAPAKTTEIVQQPVRVEPVEIVQQSAIAQLTADVQPIQKSAIVQSSPKPKIFRRVEPPTEKTKPEKSKAVKTPKFQPAAKNPTISQHQPEEQPKEYFQCLMCKSGKSREMNFRSVKDLRVHLAIHHFKDLLKREIDINLQKFPICPYPNCDALFNRENLVVEHYKMSHKFSYPGSEECHRKCNHNQCFMGPFDSFEDLLTHHELEHGTLVNEMVKKLKLEATLKPIRCEITKSVVAPGK